MARRVTPSQYRSMVRQAEAKQRQAINKFNQDVRRHNQKVKSAVDKYNREVRAHNSRVQRDRQRIKSALQKLSRTTVTQRYTVLYESSIVLNRSFTALEHSASFDESDPRYRLAVELPQQENANNLAITSALLTGEPEDVDDDEYEGDELGEEDLQDTRIEDELRNISADLHSRWHGALFALNPRNPDAARHFCSSVREIFTQILHTRAPDAAVLSALPGAALDSRGAPTRRSRIQFLLHRQGIQLSALEEFVEKNIVNVIDLFDVFNQGTHGEAGRFDIHTLFAVKRRVEDAIIFVTGIAT